MLGERANETNVARVRALLGLDEPLHLQYLKYMGRVLRGEQSPAFFGSAWTEVGVDQFPLAALLDVDPGRFGERRRDLAVGAAAQAGEIIGQDGGVAIDLHPAVLHVGVHRLVIGRDLPHPRRHGFADQQGREVAVELGVILGERHILLRYRFVGDF